VRSARPRRWTAPDSKLVAQHGELGLPLERFTAHMQQDPQSRTERQVHESKSKHRRILPVLPDHTDEANHPKSESWRPHQAAAFVRENRPLALTPMPVAQHGPFAVEWATLLSDWRSNWRSNRAKTDG
jgi:hypothetical protein